MPTPGLADQIPPTDLAFLLERLRLLRMTLSQYLATPHWKSTCRTFYNLGLGDHGCFVCGTHKRLNLHHLTYERVGCESLEDVVPLCDHHHEEVHRFLAWNPEADLETAHARFRDLWRADEYLRACGVVAWTALMDEIPF